MFIIPGTVPCSQGALSAGDGQTSEGATKNCVRRTKAQGDAGCLGEPMSPLGRLPKQSWPCRTREHYRRREWSSLSGRGDSMRKGPETGKSAVLQRR